MYTNTKLTYLDRIMMAITFAEAGEMETAKSMLDNGARKQQRTEKVAERRPSLEL